MSPSSPPSSLVVGLDIGTTKICAIVACEDEQGALSVLGIGARPSSGVRRGIVVDVPDTVAAIKDALSRAAHMAGVEIEGVVAGVTGDHILSQNRVGSVTVASQGGEIGTFDVERALAATLLEVGRDVEIIHCSPRFFSLDGQRGLRKPLGMAGSRLEVEAHVVTGQSSLLRNTFSCLSGAGVRADALVLEPLATGEAVSTRDEREMGVLVLDIGGGTSDLAAFVDGSAIYSAALPVGGNHVTRDISIGLSTPFEFAETLKVGSGAATRDMIPHGEALEVMTAGGASRLRIPRALLGEIIEARMRELFELTLAMAVHSGLAGRVPGGLILSGGGSLLPGALELAGKIFGLPVRLGMPEGVVGWSEQVASPQFATAVGLCRFALAQQQPDARRGALLLPHARRVWSFLPPHVVMARPVAPEPAPDAPSEPEAPLTSSTPLTSSAPLASSTSFASSALLASEEFPAQMQFAPARFQEQDQDEDQDQLAPEPQPATQLQAEPVLPTPVLPTPVVVPQRESVPEPESVLEPVEEVAIESPMDESVPLLAVKHEVAEAPQSVPETPAPAYVPVSRPVETPAPREREVATRVEASSKRDATKRAVEAPSRGLPAPGEGASTARSRLQELLARVSAFLDSPPAPSGAKEKAPPSKTPDAAPTAGDSPALHWWLRFKTFIGFGEE